MLLIAHHTTTVDNSHALSDEPKSQDVRSVSLKDSEGETHPGASVVACFLEKRTS